MRRLPRLHSRWITALLVWIGVLSLVSQVEASDGMRGDRCVVASSDIIVEDFYFICRVLEVQGTVDGDLIGVASEVLITSTGVVTGDLWVAGGKVTVAGQVGDDVHFAGVSLVIDDGVRFTHDRIDALSVALNTQINQQAVLPGDLLVYGYQARINGTVGGDVDFGGEALIIRGTVGGRVDASVGDVRRSTDIPGLPVYDVSFSSPGLRVDQAAQVGGDLAYEAVSPSQIPDGVVQGRVRYQTTVSQPDITKVERPDDAAKILANYLVHSLRDAVTLAIIGTLGLWLVPNLVRQPALHFKHHMIPSVGWGLITFMLSFPLAFILIVISLIVLVPLFIFNLNELVILVGIGVLVFLAVLGALFGFLLLFMGRIVIGFVIGQWIYRYVLWSPEPGTLRRWLTTLVLGTGIYALISNVPLPPLDLIVDLVAALAGVGAVVMYVRELLVRAGRLGPSWPVPSALTGGVSRVTPVVLPAETEIPLGLDNLPEGFTGFDEDW